MKMNGEIDVQLCAFFTSAPDWSEWSTARADRFVPGQKGLSVHWVTGWVGPKLIWTRQQKEEKSLHYPYQESNPDRPARSLVTILTELSRLLLISKLL
jgi:hypothetical protein